MAALLTTEQVAALFGVRPGTVAQWRARGIGPAFIRPVVGLKRERRGQPPILYHPDAVRAWARRHPEYLAIGA
jgi:hypothetical protein